MSIKLFTAAWDNGPEDRQQFIVLLSLADQANDNGICWPKQNTIARRARLEPRSVRRIMDALQAEGWLRIEERAGKSNVYHLNADRILGADTMSTLSERRGDTVSGRGGHSVRSGGTQCPVGIEPKENPKGTKIGAPSDDDAASEPKKRAMHLPEDWNPDGSVYAWAKGKGWTADEYLEEVEAFKTYWTAEGGQRARKRDWDAALRTWFGRTSPEEHRRKRKKRA